MLVRLGTFLFADSLFKAESHIYNPMEGKRSTSATSTVTQPLKLGREYILLPDWGSENVEYRETKLSYQLNFLPTCRCVQICVSQAYVNYSDINLHVEKGSFKQIYIQDSVR